jgi:hypothetical protein
MKTISEYFMAYEATKVFAIRKMKMQFTNKNTHRHIVYAKTYYRSMQCRRKLFFGEAGNEGRRPEEIF